MSGEPVPDAVSEPTVSLAANHLLARRDARYRASQILVNIP